LKGGQREGKFLGRGDSSAKAQPGQRAQFSVGATLWLEQNWEGQSGEDDEAGM
jgi:hypothetical protein